MTYTGDKLRDQGHLPMQRVWRGRIASNPTDFDVRVDVIIPGLSDNLRWDQCRWQARNDTDFPVRGNACVVVIDENNEAWVVCWWPFQ